MKNLSKKLLFITFLLSLFLIAISSASAAENTTDLGNLIITASDDSTVELGEVTYKTNVTNIKIDKNITIVGKGADKTIIDAKKAGRIFNILSNGTLKLINLTLINGNATDGGAIYNSGSLTITDCHISNNNLNDYGGGGAIYNDYSASLRIKNSIFANNNADDIDNDVYGYGGAICNLGYCTITDSYFLNNSAYHEGGAIYNEDGINMNITNSNFTNNSGVRGGAIYSFGENLTINNCNFINNKAEYGGGAIYNYGITMIISNSSFSNNIAIYGDGGSIYNDGDNMNIIKSKFTNNTADYNGGAIYNTGSQVLIRDSCFHQ